MNRQLNDNLPRLPTAVDTNKPKQRDLMAEREKHKFYHDRKLPAKQPTGSKFRPGQRVALQHHQTKERSIRGQIIEEVAPRSFNVRTSNNTTLRRNQQQIRKLHSTTSSTIPTHVETPLHEHLAMHDETDTPPNTPFSDYDSDSDNNSTSTVPYDADEEEGQDETDEDETDVLYQPMTRSGRIIRQHYPTDYSEL